MIPRNYVTLGLSLLTILFIYIGVVLVSFPYNPLGQKLDVLTQSNALKFKFFFPEGFAFFTRNPHELIYQLYTTEEEPKRAILENASKSNLFGIQKNARYQLIKLQQLAVGIPDSLWSNADIPFKQFMGHSDTVALLPQTIYSDYFEGQFLIVRKKPIPWAWSSFKDMSWEFQYAKIDVSKIL